MAYPTLERAKSVRGIYPLLNIKEVSMAQGVEKAIDKLNFSVFPGNITGIFGESGSGKAAMLHLLTGDLAPCSGRIVFNGEDVTHLPPDARRARGITCKIGKSQLFTELTALENLQLLGLENHRAMFPRQGGGTYTDEAASLLDFVGLGANVDDVVETFSMEERCLLTLAIALACRPSLLLLDSPDMQARFSNQNMPGLLSRVAQRGISIVFTSEVETPGMEICDKIIVLNKGAIQTKDTVNAIHLDRDYRSKSVEYIQ